MPTHLEEKANLFFGSFVIYKHKFNIKNISSLEKVTNTLFSSKRKMINKSIKKLLNKDKLGKLEKLNLNLRPSEINPEMYYQIAKSYEDQ